jgi:hypothetical protein
MFFKRVIGLTAGFFLGLTLPVPAGVSDTAASIEAEKPTTIHRADLNEMKGKLQSKGDDPKTLRLLVEGGFNVEFTYDRKTTMINGGSPITVDDLSYGDELIIRYSGKELNAVEVDRVSKAPRPL